MLAAHGEQTGQARGVGRARRGRARAASCRDGVAHAEPVVGHGRRLAAVGARLPGRLAAGLCARRISPTTPATTSGSARSRCPPGSYEYKAALNDSWTENYGLHAQPNGANVPLSLPADASVKFYYDHKSHWVTDNRGSVIAVAPGSFQSELGCPGDWDPGCLRSWLQDPDGNGIYSFETTRAAAGLVRGEGGDQRGLGRELRPGRRPGRGEHRVHRPGRQREGHVHLRRDVARPHDRRREPSGRPGRPRRAVALRPRPEGLPRHRPQHDLEGLVHGRERRPQRRLLPDGRQHERRDAPVRRHRRLHVHRPADARHDLRRSRRCTTPAAWPARSRRPRRAASTGSRPSTSPIPTGTRCSCASSSGRSTPATGCTCASTRR